MKLGLALAVLLAAFQLDCADESPKTSPGDAKPSAGTESLAPAAVRVAIDGLPAFGDQRAPVTLVSFVDFECPYSVRAAKTLDRLRESYGDRLRVVVASRPLPMHSRARPAALAFLAAVELGRGEDFARALWALPNPPNDEAIAAIAREIGLDPRALAARRSSERVTRALERAEALATSLDVSGTPTTFVNGRRIDGAQPFETFRAVIDEELANAERIVAGGTRRELVYDAIMATAAAARPRAPEPDADRVFEVPVGDSPLRGTAKAPVTIAVFSDFECHYCARLEKKLKALEDEYQGRVNVSFRHRPLPIHDNARIAAKAAIAAESQGRFWQLHDLIISHRDSLDRAQLEKLAVEAGLDGARFARDLDDARTEQRLARDETLAVTLGVKGTPTSFVNGRRIVGDQSIATFRAAIDRALAERSAR